jgi:2-haloacid dehalogenase
VARAGAGQGAEDRPPEADLHRRPDPRLRAGRRALGAGLSGAPRGVVWDLGNVLIDWQPRRAIAAGVGEDEADRFLAADDFDFLAFNHGPDAGGSWDEAEDAVRRTHPHWAEHALAYRANFEASLVGEVPGSVDLVRELRGCGVAQWGLTNWSHELWPHAPRLFPFLDELLDGVVVSGTERLAKPDPRVYALVADRMGLPAADLVFVDDKQANVDAAREAGLDGVVFTGADDLRSALRSRGLPVEHVHER